MGHDPQVIVVGINPASGSPDKLCQSIKRLSSWADKIGIRYYSFVNCIGRPGPYSQKDVEYDFLRECVKGYDKVLALGGFPSQALKKLGVDHFTLPHPSGLNRKLNDRDYEKRVLEECSEYIKA
jgi:hypothetical protein